MPKGKPVMKAKKAKKAAPKTMKKSMKKAGTRRMRGY
jgi:hypothetical protein